MTLDCCLHVGIGKAGTSSLQSFLVKNRKNLQEWGVLFPLDILPGGRVGGDNNKCLAVSCTDSRNLDNFVLKQHRVDSVTARRRFDQTVRSFYRKQIREALSETRRCILSAEHFWACLGSSAAVGRLADSLESVGLRVRRVILYMRRQSDWFESMQYQRLREGRELFPDDATVLLGSGMAAQVDYSKVIALWESGFPEAVISPRVFEKRRLSGGDLFQDFLEASGLGGANDFDGLVRPDNQNVTSLSALGVAVMKAINERVPAFDSEGRINAARGDLVRHVEASFKGRTKILSAATRATIDDAYAESNAAVKERFFPELQALFTPGEARDREGVCHGQMLEHGVPDEFIEFIIRIWKGRGE